jgi:uncharacterized membrane protein
MADEFAGMGIAVIIVTASIVLSGILFGVGRAFSYKNLEYFGIEELLQSVINAALIGSFAVVTGLVASVSASIVTPGCSAGSIITQLTCMLGIVNTNLFALFQTLIQMLNILGYYQGLSLNFGAFSVVPFGNLASVSGVLSAQLLSLNLIMILVGLNAQITIFIEQNALSLLFPVGLVLRSLFVTRKVGGFLIALAVGLYIFYPAFVLIFPSPQTDLANTTALVATFNNNSFYAPVPVVDLNSNYALAGKLDVMSGRCASFLNSSLMNYTGNQSETNQSNSTLLNSTLANVTVSNCQNFTNLTSESTDFSGDMTVIAGSTTNVLGESLLYTVVAPLFSLLITAVFIKELGSILGSEIGLRTVASI